MLLTYILINNMLKYFKSNSSIRVCTKCRRTCFRPEFYKNKSTLSGLDNYCKNCRNQLGVLNRGKFQSSYRFVNEAKIRISRGNLACICCGNKNFEWLQIDHIMPVKGKRNGNQLSTITRQIIQGKISIDRFQLLCAVCNYAKKDLQKCPIDHSLD